MEKKNTAPTVAEQKQEFLLPKSANVFKSELLRAAREIFSIANRIRIQSAILTDDDLRPYTKEFNGSIQEFIKRYAPAKSWEQADEHFTSSEIAEMFNSVYPIPLENIFEALKSNGFTCVPLSGQPTFVWLLTLKQK